MVSFVNAISKICVERNSKNMGEVWKKALKPAIDNGAKVIESKSVRTIKFSVAEAMSKYHGETSLKLKNQFDKILKEAKTKGKIKLDISEIAQYMENQGMTAEMAQNRAAFLTNLDKLKASGAIETYLPKGTVNVGNMEDALLARIDRIL